MADLFTQVLPLGDLAAALMVKRVHGPARPLRHELYERNRATT